MEREIQHFKTEVTSSIKPQAHYDVNIINIIITYMGDRDKIAGKVNSVLYFIFFLNTFNTLRHHGRFRFLVITAIIGVLSGIYNLN